MNDYHIITADSIELCSHAASVSSTSWNCITCIRVFVLLFCLPTYQYNAKVRSIFVYTPGTHIYTYRLWILNIITGVCGPMCYKTQFAIGTFSEKLKWCSLSAGCSILCNHHSPFPPHHHYQSCLYLYAATAQNTTGCTVYSLSCLCNYVKASSFQGAHYARISYFYVCLIFYIPVVFLSSTYQVT